MGSQRVRHDLANEKQQQARKVLLLLLVSCLSFPVLFCLLCIQRGEWMIYHWSFISFEHTTVNLFSQTSNLHKWLQNEPYSETQTENFVSALILRLSVPYHKHFQYFILFIFLEFLYAVQVPIPLLMCVCVQLSHFSCVWLFATLWAVAHQAPLSMGFSRPKYWSGLPCPPAEDLPDPGIEPKSLKSPALAGDSLPRVPPGKPHPSLHPLPFTQSKHTLHTLVVFFFFPT